VVWALSRGQGEGKQLAGVRKNENAEVEKVQSDTKTIPYFLQWAEKGEITERNYVDAGTED